MGRLSLLYIAVLFLILPSISHSECTIDQLKVFSTYGIKKNLNDNVELVKSGYLLPCEIYLCDKATAYLNKLKANEIIKQELCTKVLESCSNIILNDDIELKTFAIDTEKELEKYPDCDGTVKIDFKRSKCYNLIKGIL